MEVLDEVHYLKPGIGYFPALQGKVKHGFSWGKGSPNMRIDLSDNKEQTLKEINYFLNYLHLDDFSTAVGIGPEHSDQVVYIDKKNFDKSNAYLVYDGKTIDCDALFTLHGELTLTVKPADCAIAVVYCPRARKEAIVGLIHTGWRGLNLELPKKAVNYLVENLDCEINDIQIGITPQIFQKNMNYQSVEAFNNPEWSKFMEEKDGVYYPDIKNFGLKQYLDAGVKSQNITIYNIDTFEAAKNGESFSYKYFYEMDKIGKSVPNGRYMVAVG